MTYAQESSRIASVRFAERHGLTDTEPVPDGHSAAGFIRIGTAICTDPGGGTAVYGVYGFKGIAGGGPLALAAWLGTRYRGGGNVAPAPATVQAQWCSLVPHFTVYRPGTQEGARP
jgi:hypothetical protein